MSRILVSHSIWSIMIVPMLVECRFLDLCWIMVSHWDSDLWVLTATSWAKSKESWNIQVFSADTNKNLIFLIICSALPMHSCLFELAMTMLIPSYVVSSGGGLMPMYWVCKYKILIKCSVILQYYSIQYILRSHTVHSISMHDM